MIYDLNEDRIRFEVDPATGCHVWNGPKSDKGYARTMIDGVLVSVSRLLWQIFRGPIPAGWFVLHSCDNPPCVNLEHLHLGTHDDNMREMVERDRAARQQGTLNGQAVLTEDDVRAIRASFAKGKTLAKKHRVSPATISKIKSRKLWPHVE